MMNITVNGVEFSYGSTPILKGVDFEIPSSEFIGIIGPNGSGKTTLIKCINRILSPKQGEILIGDVSVADMKRNELAKIIGYVPQNNSGGINSPSVYEVVIMGRKPHGSWQMNSNDEDIVWTAMEEMNVEDLAVKRFDELSSGQAQRVLLARALAQDAQIMLLDEPTSNLDLRHQLDVMEVVSDLVKRKNVGACVIMHDMELAVRYCSKVILMQNGLITAAGRTLDVITPENIKKVYGVDVVIDKNYGKPHIIVL